MTKRRRTVKRDKKARELLPFSPLVRYSIEEASAWLRQSRAKTYEQIASGELLSFLDGGRRYIAGETIVARCRQPNQEAQAVGD